MKLQWYPAAVLLLLKLQTVDEHSLQLSDVVTGLYRDTEPAWGAWETASWVVHWVIVTLAEVFVEGASDCTLKILADIQVVVLWGETAVVLGVVCPVMEVVSVFRTRAVTGTVGRAVGHQAGLQAAVPPHSSVQIQSGNQRLSDADAFGPVDGIVIHGCEGALKAHSEDQLLLWHTEWEIVVKTNTIRSFLLLKPRNVDLELNFSEYDSCCMVTCHESGF